MTDKRPELLPAEYCRCRPPKPYREGEDVRCAWCDRIIKGYSRVETINR